MLDLLRSCGRAAHTGGIFEDSTAVDPSLALLRPRAADLADFADVVYMPTPLVKTLKELLRRGRKASSAGSIEPFAVEGDPFLGPA